MGYPTTAESWDDALVEQRLARIADSRAGFYLPSRYSSYQRDAVRRRSAAPRSLKARSST